MYKKILFSLWMILIPALCCVGRQRIEVSAGSGSGQTEFAVQEIRDALAGWDSRGITDSRPLSIVLLSCDDKNDASIIRKLNVSRIKELREEGFLIVRKGRDKIYVIGYDRDGAMYGGLEVAETIRTGGIESVRDILQNPYLKLRGTKFNISMDARTPTYSEPSDAAQINIKSVWDFDFWKEYIDNLARYRYNLVSLWSLHPFPSMVRVPEYPDIALEDVHKSRVKWEEYYSLRGIGLDAPEISGNCEVVKKMTMDEKIDFWRKVMAYGKTRNVDFCIVTWNLFISGTEGKYGITESVDNETTTDYFRKSVREMILTYPDLAGIGLTAGENMADYSASKKEKWAFATYGQGVLDALQEQPDRKILFIHRQHESSAREIKSVFKDLLDNGNVNFLLGFKYAKAHVYSSVDQPYYKSIEDDVSGSGLKVLWTLRNDDAYYFRWAAPDFVRDFIKGIPYEMSEGYYFGADQYVWVRDFLSLDHGVPHTDIELKRHWLQWMLWGRLGYDPGMSDSRFAGIIENKFPGVDGEQMLRSWQDASMVYPLVTGFHWGQLDFQWYIEGCKSRPFVSGTPSGYNDINAFIKEKTHPGTDNISIPDYVAAKLAGRKIRGTSPIELADEIIARADRALDWARTQGREGSEELRSTVEDIMSMAYLGHFYAHKIKAATHIHEYRASSDPACNDRGVEELNLSAASWRQYAALSLSNYKNPLWTNRVGNVDWKESFDWALYEVIQNGGKLNLKSMEPSPGGTILEAEDTPEGRQKTSVVFNGFTGSGYVGITGGGHSLQPLTWKFNSPAGGRYVLEFRYTLTREDTFPTDIRINGESSGAVEFWNCGYPGNWVSVRKTVWLRKGENTIFAAPERFVCVDHLNVIKCGDDGFSVNSFQESDKAFVNPDKGFRADDRCPYSTLNKVYVRWNAIENSADDGVEKILEYSEKVFTPLYEKGIRVIPRVYLAWPYKTQNAAGSRIKMIAFGKEKYLDCFWPEDMTTMDYSSEQFKDRVVKLIAKLGQAWDNDKRVAFVETGIIGNWGEQHSPAPTPEMQKLIADSYLAAFKNKKLMVRNYNEFTDYSFGYYWDSFANIDQTDHLEGIVARGDIWKESVEGGEVAYDWGRLSIQPGESPDKSLSDPEHLNYIIDCVRRIHTNHLGWISRYTVGDEKVAKGAAELQKALGYRFIIPSVKFKLDRNRILSLEMNIRNVGSSPLYEKYPLEISLIDPATRKPVWKGRPEADCTRWMPGDNWNTERREYEFPAPVNVINGSFVLPDSLKDGEYLLAVALLSPYTGMPAVRFAMDNYLKGGYTVLGRVGLGKAVDNNGIEGILFDDISNERLKL